MSYVPRRIFCPACGEELRTEEITDPKDLEIVRKGGFMASGRFMCRCGVVGMINVRPMPESPTWTIAFDRYLVGVTSQGSPRGTKPKSKEKEEVK